MSTLRGAKILDPVNPANPYDFAGKYIEDALAYANGTTDVSIYYSRIIDYINAKPLQMFALPVQMTTAEKDSLAAFKGEIDKTTDINGRIIKAKIFEVKAYTSRDFSTEQKQRVLYILSTLKYAFYLSETNGATIDIGDAISFVIEVVGYNRINIGEPSNPEPPGRPKCGEWFVRKMGPQCVETRLCRRTLFGFEIGKPYEDYGDPYNCYIEL